MERGKKIRLEQRTKAESDPAVAAASILARAEFLQRLAKLSGEAKLALPKGASKMVEDAARLLVKRDGPQALQDYAKYHFRTTQVILGATK